MSDENEQLKAELVAKAKAAGVWNAQSSWGVETLEKKIAEAALKDPTESVGDGGDGSIEGDDGSTDPAADTVEKDARIEQLEAEVEALKAQVKGLLNDVRALTNAPAQHVEQPEDGEDPDQTDTSSNEPVTVRITKKGDGKVANGEGGSFSWEDEVELPYAVALGLEDKGFAEIVE